MIKSLKGITVGQQLWFVPKHIRPDGRGEQPRFMAVTKIGRKWLQIDWLNRRASIETGVVFHEHSLERSLGHCYADRDAHQAEADLAKAWQEFRQRVDRLHLVPLLVTQEWLIEARRIIGTK